MRKILAPRIEWASTLVVLIGSKTADSWWVNREIEHAIKEGKSVIGVYARGATDADIPDALRKCGDAAIVGWQAERVVDAINGKLITWDQPESGDTSAPQWTVDRYTCR